MSIIKKIIEFMYGSKSGSEHLDYTTVANREKWQKNMEDAGVEFIK